MRTLKDLLPLILLAVAAAAALSDTPAVILTALALALALQAAIRRRRLLRSSIPAIILIASISLLQWIQGTFDPLLPPKILAVFWLAISAGRLIPWPRIANRFRHGAYSSQAILYLLFVRHFAYIISAEARRLLTARSRTVLKPFGRWSFRSLAAAVASLFTRAMARAEHFHAALMLKGFAE